MKPLYNQNKQHASEILNVLLQNDKENRLILGSLNGIDILLRVASVSNFTFFYFFILQIFLSNPHSTIKSMILPVKTKKNLWPMSLTASAQLYSRAT